MRLKIRQFIFHFAIFTSYIVFSSIFLHCAFAANRPSTVWFVHFNNLASIVRTATMYEYFNKSVLYASKKEKKIIIYFVRQPQRTAARMGAKVFSLMYCAASVIFTFTFSQWFYLYNNIFYCSTTSRAHTIAASSAQQHISIHSFWIDLSFILVWFLFRNCFHVHRLRFLLHLIWLCVVFAISWVFSSMPFAYIILCRLQDASLIFAYSFRFHIDRSSSTST